MINHHCAYKIWISLSWGVGHPHSKTNMAPENARNHINFMELSMFIWLYFVFVFVNYNHRGEDRIHNYTAYPKWDEPCNTWIPPKLNSKHITSMYAHVYPHTRFFSGNLLKNISCPKIGKKNHESSFVKGRFRVFFRTTFHWNLLLCHNAPSWNPIAWQKDSRWSDCGREEEIQFSQVKNAVFFFETFFFFWGGVRDGNPINNSFSPKG